MASTARDPEKQTLLGIKRPSFPEISDTDVPSELNTRSSGCCPRRTTIGPLQLFYFLASIASQPLTQQYLHYRFAEQYSYVDTNSNVTSCQSTTPDEDPIYQKVQKSTSEFNTIVIVCTTVPIILSVAITGPLSDKKGRKPFLLIALFGSFTRAIFSFVVMYKGLSLYWLVGLSLFEGILGGPGAVIAMLFAYAADITRQGGRLSQYILLDFLTNIAYASALLLIGQFIIHLGFSWAMFVISCILLGCFVYATTLPETVLVQPITWKELKYIPTKIIMLYASNEDPKKRKKSILIIFAFLVFMIIETGSSDIMTYVLLNPPVCMTSTQIGLYSSLAFMARGGGSFLAIYLLKGILPELGIATAGCLCSIAYYLALASVTSYTETFFTPMFGFFSLTQVPIMRSSASRLGSNKEQGALMASLAVLQMLANAVGGSLYNSIYSEALSRQNGFMFRLSAVLIFIPAGLITYLWVMVEREGKQTRFLPNYSPSSSSISSSFSSTEESSFPQERVTD